MCVGPPVELDDLRARELDAGGAGRGRLIAFVDAITALLADIRQLAAAAVRRRPACADPAIAGGSDTGRAPDHVGTYSAECTEHARRALTTRHRTRASVTWRRAPDGTVSQ
jgi:hypothetical protein